MKPNSFIRVWAARLTLFAIVSVGITQSQAQLKVLLVGGQGEPTQGADGFIFDKLVERFGEGNISYIGSGDSTTEDAADVDVVILSSTPGSGSIVSKFRDVPQGVINWEEAISHEDRAGGFAFHQGGRPKSPQSMMTITDSGNYITAHLEVGDVDLFSEDVETWAMDGDLAETVQVLATVIDDGLPTIGIAEEGSALRGDVVAVGRRVMLPMTDAGSEFFTDEGWEMFLRSVEWAGKADKPPGQIFDFNEEPDLEIVSNTDTTEWRASGGVDDSGYLSLTDAVGGAQASIIFPPVADPISAFKFGVDARIGGDKDRPADGFSINIVRADDPILADPRGSGYAVESQFPGLGGLQEEGSQTGLGIGFDTWDNGKFNAEALNDGVGFSIRVDGTVVEEIPATTPNGEPGDETSLQTGPVGVEDPPIENLSWQRFEVELTSDRKLNITWKGKPVLEDFAVEWFPSENMQIVLGARTGGSWEAHHFDNLSLEVVTTNTARITSVDRSRSGVVYTIEDSEESQLQLDSIGLTIDGAAVTPTVEQVDGVTTVSYMNEALWDFGTEHPWVLTAKDQNDLDVGAEGVIKIPSPLFPPGVELPGPAGIDGAFSSRYIFEAGTIASMTTAIDIVMQSEDAAFTGGIIDAEHEVIDHGGGGFFTNDFPYPDDFEAGEDFIQLNKGNILITEAGDYTFGVQSDDGFGVRVHGMTFHDVNGAGQLDSLIPDAFYFRGTTGNSQTRAIARDVQPGVYPLEFLWFERGGGDYGEIFAAQGAFPLIEDTDTWELIGEGIQLVGIPVDAPELVNFTFDENVTLDFTTPSPESLHFLQTSTSLKAAEWTIIDDAALTNVDDLYTLTAARPAEEDAYFRVAILPPPPLFVEDFEGGAEGWTATEPWELGTPAVDDLMAAHGGENTYGTDLDGLVDAGVNASLRSPVIDLAGVGRPRLSFWYYHDTTEDSEGVQLKILNEAGDQAIYTHDQIFWGKTDDWTEFRLTVPAEAREQKVMIEWLLLTADGGEAGFYLDDVEVD
ncbi:MAG: hypothetical protein L7V86_13870 [Verrucomicrobiales bacterium]|nr:hypothetical protein [Verrucomicrobiales bacterium]